MKKTLFSILMLIAISLSTSAQKIKWDGVSVAEWQVKRCYIKNDKCILDLLITNEGSTDIRSFLRCRYSGSTPFTIAYDDEGNNYEYIHPAKQKPSKHILNGETTINGQTDNSGQLTFDVPAGLTVKAHIVINDFDEFATKLNLVKLMFGQGMANGGYATLEIRDIPLQRE